MNEKNAKVLVSSSGFPVPVEQRPLWRMGIICCCIQQCSKDDSGISLGKVKLLCWMAIRKHYWSKYLDYFCDKVGGKPKISLDRSTDKAIEIGLRKSFFEFHDGKLRISENGTALLEIIDENSLFLDEKDFFISIKSKVTEKEIRRVV